MKKFFAWLIQILLFVAVFASVYYFVEASTSVKVILAYIISMSFSKVMEKFTDGDDKEKIQIQIERIDELESEIQMLNDRVFQLQSMMDELSSEKLATLD